MDFETLNAQMSALRRAALVLANINKELIKKIERIQEKLDDDNPDVPGSLEIIREKIDA